MPCKWDCADFVWQAAAWNLPKGDRDECLYLLLDGTNGPILPSVLSELFLPAARLDGTASCRMINDENVESSAGGPHRSAFLTSNFQLLIPLVCPCQKLANRKDV